MKTKSERVSKTAFFKHKYITQPTLTSEDIIIKALQDLKHAIKSTKNIKGNENLEALKKVKEIFDETPVAKVKEKAKRVQFLENVPKVLNYSEGSRVPFMQTKANVTNKQTLTVPTSNQQAPSVIRTPTRRRSVRDGNVTARLEPPRVAMTPRIIAAEKNVLAMNTRAWRTQAGANGPAENTRGQVSGKHLMSAIETFNKNKRTKDICPMKALCEMANDVVDVETGNVRI